MPNRMSYACALASVLLAYPAMAQMPPPQAAEQSKARSAQFQANVAEVVRSPDKEPRRYRPAARHAEVVDTSISHLGFRCVV